MKKALITGITGQDGSYLAEYLLSKGYQVFGLVRRQSMPSFDRIDHILDKITFVEGDMHDQASLDNAVKDIQPDEIYNLAAQSFVGTSFKLPVYTVDVGGVGVIRLLDSVRKFAPQAKFYQASTSELFGKVRETPQKESTPFYPRSPYGIAKLAGYWAVVNYRESYGLFAVNGILFNHESPRRGIEFVTRKISDGVARIVTGKMQKLKLGNMDAKRDWGFAGDYVKAMHLMLQQDKPEDFVIGTGETHSVQEFVEEAFAVAGLDWQKYVETDKVYYRPAEVDVLVADARKAREKFGWKPDVNFKQLVKMMVESDIKKHKEGKTPSRHPI